MFTALKESRTVSSAPKGLDFIRAGIAHALYPKSRDEAARYPEARWGEKSKAALIAKAAVPGLTSGTGAGAAIISLGGAEVEFFDLVRAASVIGRLPVRKVPFYTRLLTQDEGLRVEWRGEGSAYRSTPVKMTAVASLPPLDVGALMVSSKEVMRDASIDAELWIRDQLARALALALDIAFIDPSNGGSAGVRPASVTSGAGSSNSPLEALFDWGDEFSGNPDTAFILLNPFTAARLQAAARPNVGARGGTLGGCPVLTSTAVGAEDIILVDATQIAVAMGNVSLRATEQAAIELADSSSMASGPTPTAVNVTSLFQSDSFAIIGSVNANWQVLRPGAVLLFNTQNYGL